MRNGRTQGQSLQRRSIYVATNVPFTVHRLIVLDEPHNVGSSHGNKYLCRCVDHHAPYNFWSEKYSLSSAPRMC